MGFSKVLRPGRGEAVAVIVLCAAVGGGLLLVLSKGAQSVSSDAIARNACASMQASGVSGLTWQPFSATDRSDARNGDWGSIESLGMKADMDAGDIARVVEYVAVVDIIKVGKLRYNSDAGVRPSSEEFASNVDAGRAFAPAVLWVERMLKSPPTSASVCAFLVPVWMPMGPHDEVGVSDLAENLEEGLRGIAFLNEWPNLATPWSTFLYMEHQATVSKSDAQRLRVASIGKFYPMANNRIVGRDANGQSIDAVLADIANAAHAPSESR